MVERECKARPDRRDQLGHRDHLVNRASKAMQARQVPWDLKVPAALRVQRVPLGLKAPRVLKAFKARKEMPVSHR